MKPELKRLCWPFNFNQTSLCPFLPSFHIPSTPSLSLTPPASHPPHIPEMEIYDCRISPGEARHHFLTGSTSAQREKRRARYTAPSRIQPPSISPAGTLPAFLLSLWFIYQHSWLHLLHTSEAVIPEGKPSNIRGIPHWGTGAEMLHMGKK